MEAVASAGERRQPLAARLRTASAEARSVVGHTGTTHSIATIDVRIRTLAQLFHSLDPSPFHERRLDREAGKYILESASEFLPDEPLRILIHAPENVRTRMDEATQAIHGHYRAEHAQAERRHRRRMHLGRVALLIGSGVMLVSLTLRALLGEWITTPVGQGVGEGLLILGWVVLWRPAELLLFERFENRQERRLLDRLAQIPVDFEVLPGDQP